MPVVIIPLVSTRRWLEQWALGGEGQWLTLQHHPQSWAHCQGHQVCRYVRLVLRDDFSTLADVLRFDNTYSLMHTKKVSYTVEVLLPDKASEEKIQGFEARRPSPAQ